MTLSARLADRAARAVGARSSRRDFLGRTALVGTALAAAGPTYVLRPGTAYAAITRTSCSACGSGLCCDGYTEFCCHLDPDGANECPPGTLLAGWWKVDNSDFCFGTARYYMDCNKAAPGCGCGSGGVCQDDPGQCGCKDCQSRKNGCTVFRYGNCNNQVACVGPIMCRVVTCTKPWEIEPTCSQVARTDDRTRNHHRPCLERDADAAEIAFVRALYADFLGRASDPSGELYWGNILVRGSHLDSGVRDVIADSFAHSEEYVGFVVDQLYLAVLGRSAEPAGRDHWRAQLRDGLAPRDLAVVLVASEEFWLASGSQRAGFVERAYLRILGRTPAPAERDGWVGALDDGHGRDVVAAAIYDSEESRRIRVAALYDRFLGRAPEPGGHAYWTDVLADSEDLSLALYLAASDEYWLRSGARFPVTTP